MARMSVGVIFGGRSVEHDVSIVTAHQVMAALSERHTVVPIYITREGRWLTSPELNDLEIYRRRRWDDVGQEAYIPPVTGFRGLYVPGGRLRSYKRIPLDVVIPAVHGTYGEDGTLQGLLELAGMRYTGPGVVGAAIGMDKVAMKAAFKASGLPIPPHVVIRTERLDADPASAVRSVEDRLGYPVFAKPATAGSSVGIGKAADGPALLEALDVARRYDETIVVEKSMEGCIEINCSVLGGPGHPPRASVCDQPIPWQDFLSFEDKYLRDEKGAKTLTGMAGQTRRIPAPISEQLTKQVQENSLAAFEAVGATGVARVDSFVDEDSGETWVMEINTTPGSFSFYLWEPAGLGFSDLLETLIDIAIESDRIRSQRVLTFDSGMLERRGAKTGG